MYLGHKRKGFIARGFCTSAEGNSRAEGAVRGSGILQGREVQNPRAIKPFLARGAYIALSAGEFITSVLHELELVLLN